MEVLYERGHTYKRVSHYYKMKKFRTHLVISNLDSEKIKKISTDSFQYHLSPEPTNCYWESIDGSSSLYSPSGKSNKYINPNDIQLNELIILSNSEEQAEDILSIIHGGVLLAYPEPSLISGFVFLEEYNVDKNSLYEKPDFHIYYKKIDNVAFGCEVASLSILEPSICYAIEKYKVSLELDSFTPRSADPQYGQVFEHYDIKHCTHTRSAFAIIAAFSVIEELGLEIRSSSKNKRFNNNETGEWNPTVLMDINDRLEKSGISSDMTFDWIYRGSPTEIEKEFKPYFGYDSEWIKYGSAIRDKTLTFPEAIHNASLLRNFYAAHKFCDLTKYISPYDVFNVQCLARKLILHKLGLWNKMINRNK